MSRTEIKEWVKTNWMKLTLIVLSILCLYLLSEVNHLSGRIGIVAIRANSAEDNSIHNNALILYFSRHDHYNDDHFMEFMKKIDHDYVQIRQFNDLMDKIKVDLNRK